MSNDNGNSAVVTGTSMVSIDAKVEGFAASRLVVNNTGTTNYVFAKVNGTATAGAGSVPVPPSSSVEWEMVGISTFSLIGSAASTVDWYSQS